MSNDTILILENDSHIKWTLKTFLESEKYTVITEDTLNGTFGKLSEIKVSGLITEYRTNHPSTLDTIRELKRIFPEAYVMMLTNSEVKENEYEEIINSGVDDFFLKPCSFKKILLHLRKGLRQHNIIFQEYN